MPPTRSRYLYLPHLLLLPLLRVLFGIPSSPSRDGALLLRGAYPQPRALNVETIPTDSPFVAVFNHYDHPGLGAWCGAVAMLCAIAARRTREPRDLHLTMTREWWYPRGLGRAVKQPLTHWFFGRLARTYGLIRLPPVLGNGEFRGEGALAIRRAVELTRGKNPQLVGIAPEGRTGDQQALCEPPPGAGLFLLLLTHETIPCLPVGIFEDDASTLTIHFGAPFSLCAPRNLPREARDCAATRQVMIEIGKLLPERMWGVYREEIEKRGEHSPRVTPQFSRA